MFLILVPKLYLGDLKLEDPSLAGLLIFAECFGVRSFFSGVVLDHFVILDQLVDGLELPVLLVELELPLQEFFHGLAAQIANLTLVGDLYLEVILVSLRATLFYDYLRILYVDFAILFKLFLVVVEI